MISRRVLAIVISIGMPVAILIAGVAMFLVLGALKPKPERATEAPAGLPVHTALIEWTGAELTVRAQGEVRPLRTAEISAQVGGRAIYVSPKLVDGVFISEGDVLVRIEDSDYRLAVVRARAAVAGARRVLALAEAEVEQARADWDEFGRDKPSSLALRLPQLEEARANLVASMAAVADAELRLERTSVRSPFDGRVIDKSVEIGQYVAPGMSLVSAFATEAVEVELLVSGQNLGDIGLSTAFDGTGVSNLPEVRLLAEVAGREAKWIARAVRTGARIDTSTRMISVYARLDDPFGAGADDGVPLIPGMFVDAEIEGRIVDEARSAPRAALRGRDILYVVEQTADGKGSVLRTVRVDVVHSTPERVYFVSDLSEGERVIISPVQAARDGMSVAPINLATDGDEAITQGG